MIRIGLASTSVYPQSTETSFRMAREAGYDGVEVMVTQDALTRSPDRLLELVDKYEMPIFSIHAPVLILTTFVWGRDPQIKLERSAELAAAVGATSVIVHPPFRWQAGYAERFLQIVDRTKAASGVEIAVENMFPWKVRGRSMKAYSPSPNPLEMDTDAVCLDFSHAALSGLDAMELTLALGERLHHIHLCDGSGSMDEGKIFDEHLVPGRGSQPVAEVLQYLADRDWKGDIAAEINTRKARTEAKRMAMLRETVEFARAHTVPRQATEPAADAG